METEGLVALLGDQQGVVTAQQGLEDVFASDTSVQDSEGMVPLTPRVQGRAQKPARHLGESFLVQVILPSQLDLDSVVGPSSSTVLGG
jgi:hypothetical protein